MPRQLTPDQLAYALVEIRAIAADDDEAHAAMVDLLRQVLGTDDEDEGGEEDAPAEPF